MSSPTTSTTTTTTPNDIVKELNNILFRFALIDGAASFEKFLDQYLSDQIIGQLNSNDELVKKKVLEVLSNINKRTLVSTNVQFPIQKLLSLYHNTNSSPTTKNFAIIYIEKGFKTSSNENKLPFLNQIAIGINKVAPAHQDIFCHIILSIITAITTIPRNENEKEALFSFIKDQSDCKVILSFFLDVLLTPPPNQIKNAEGVLEIPPCHSQLSLQRVMGKTFDKYDFDALVNRKLSILNLLSAGLFVDNDILIHLIISSSDSVQSVQRKAEDALKRLPKVKFENEVLINQLYAMFIGTPDTQTDVPVDKRKRPASPAIREKFLHYFSRSILAANKFPLTLQVIFESVYGLNTNMKLKQAAISFVQWVFRHASDDQIKSMSTVIYSGLLKLVNELDSYSGKEVNELKSFTFTALGLLCKRNKDLFRKDISLISNLMARVSKEDALVASAIQDALVMIREAFISPTPEIAAQLIPILMEFVQNVDMSGDYHIRTIVLQWAQHCFPFDNVQSRYISLFFSGDSRPDIRDEAKRGLGPYKHQDNMLIPGDTKQPYPEFTKLLLYIIENRNQTLKSKKKLPQGVIQVLGFSPLTFDNILILLRKSLYHTALANKKTPSQYVKNTIEADDNIRSSYRQLIDVGLEAKCGDDILLSSVTSLLELFNLSESMIPLYTDKLDFFNSLLKATTKQHCKDLFSKAIGLISFHVEKVHLDTLLDQYQKKIQSETDMLEVYGPMNATAYIIANHLKNQQQQRISREFIKEFINSIFKKYIGHTNQMIKVCTVSSIGLVGTYSPLPLDNDEITPIINKFIELVKSSSAATERNVSETAIQSLGYICFGEIKSDKQTSLKKQVINSLFELVNNKNEEMQFTVGETLSLIIGGHKMRQSIFPFSPFTSEEIIAEKSNTIEVLGIDDDGDSSKEMNIDSSDKEQEGQDLTQVFERILNSYFSDRQSPVTRCSAGIWMVCLLRNFGKLPVMQLLLPLIQNGFISLLSDNNELTQDIASKGITLVYDSSNDAQFKEFLVSNLTKTLSGKPAQKAPGSSELLPEGAVSKTAGSVMTFKELSSVATDLGKPDMIYRLMNLSNHHSIWNSRKGASFAIVSLASRAKDDLEPLLPYLVPKIYKLMYDPSPKIAQSMKNIMSSLIDTKDIFPRFFEPIIKEIIQGMGTNSWRVRDASCAALPDAISRATPEEILPYLEELYYMNFRTLDDIKESVRKSAEVSIKSLGSISARLCDPAYTSTSKAQSILKLVLPFLLQKGISNDSNEVKQFSVQQLVKISKNAKTLLAPYIAEMTLIIIESMSSLEPAQFNYAAMHAESLNVSQEQLDSIRVEIAKSSPLTELLEVCLKYIDETNIAQVMANLIQIIQFSVGVVTRVGVAKFVANLFQSKSAPLDQIPPATIQKLINTMYPSLLDKSVTTRNQFITALSFIIRKSPSTIIKSTFDKILLLISPQSDPLELNTNLMVVGQIFKELYRNASSEITIYNRDVIPILYFYKSHPQKEISDLYKFVWDEVSVGSIKLYTDEVIQLISVNINSSTWTTKEQAALCLSSLTEDIRNMMTVHLPKILELVVQGLKGRTYQGKDSLLTSLSTLCTVCVDSIQTPNSNLPSPLELTTIMFGECKKNDLFYKRKAITNLITILKAFKNVDIYEKAKEEFYPFVFDQDAGATDKMDTNADDEDSKTKPLKALIRSSIYEVLGESFSSASRSTQSNNLDLGEKLINKLLASLWSEQVSILGSLKLYYHSIIAAEPTLIGNQFDKQQLSSLFEKLFNCLEYSKYQLVKKAIIELFDEFVSNIDKIQNVKEYLPAIKEKVVAASQKEQALGVQVDRFLKVLDN
ncbi:hypothetical protein CYY_008805, partial [Polysphondylium violaceum]